MHKHLPSKTRAGITALTCVAFAAALATALPAAAQARLPQPIYFWSNIPEPVSPIFVSNPLVNRPSTFLLFEDGQTTIVTIASVSFSGLADGAHRISLRLTKNGLRLLKQGGYTPTVTVVVTYKSGSTPKKIRATITLKGTSRRSPQGVLIKSCRVGAPQVGARRGGYSGKAAGRRSSFRDRQAERRCS